MSRGIGFFIIVGEIGPDRYFRHLETIRFDLLDLYGTSYIIDHVVQSANVEDRARAYEAYIAEISRLSCENIASITTGKYISAKWVDIDHVEKTTEKPKNGNEIAAGVIKRAGLLLKGEGKVNE